MAGLISAGCSTDRASSKTFDPRQLLMSAQELSTLTTELGTSPAGDRFRMTPSDDYPEWYGTTVNARNGIAFTAEVNRASGDLGASVFMKETDPEMLYRAKWGADSGRTSQSPVSGFVDTSIVCGVRDQTACLAWTWQGRKSQYTLRLVFDSIHEPLEESVFKKYVERAAIDFLSRLSSQ
ncbi:hypothetical protein [Lapillicoccus jejuensis]|uniref:hypothetical protein n=1 Tax=Lapillicoccus jejuensis TaxID=402171 RepID=UPI00115415F6|nr:hypothetical protein [Lapillicoccus jejuensis]